MEEVNHFCDGLPLPPSLLICILLFPVLLNRGVDLQGG